MYAVYLPPTHTHTVIRTTSKIVPYISLKSSFLIFKVPFVVVEPLHYYHFICYNSVLKPLTWTPFCLPYEICTSQHLTAPTPRSTYIVRNLGYVFSSCFIGSEEKYYVIGWIYQKILFLSSFRSSSLYFSPLSLILFSPCLSIYFSLQFCSLLSPHSVYIYIYIYIYIFVSPSDWLSTFSTPSPSLSLSLSHSIVFSLLLYLLFFCFTLFSLPFYLSSFPCLTLLIFFLYPPIISIPSLSLSLTLSLSLVIHLHHISHLSSYFPPSLSLSLSLIHSVFFSFDTRLYLMVRLQIRGV